jgi:hypothetical protein
MTGRLGIGKCRGIELSLKSNRPASAAALSNQSSAPQPSKQAQRNMNSPGKSYRGRPAAVCSRQRLHAGK